MSDKLLDYEGYCGSVDCCLDTNVLYGKVLFITDVVTYEAETPLGLKQEFEAAVKDYKETCEQLGCEPCVPFRGSFNVRIPEKMHRLAAVKSKVLGISLNELVKDAIDCYLDKNKAVESHIHHHTHQYPTVSFELDGANPSNENEEQGRSEWRMQ